MSGAFKNSKTGDALASSVAPGAAAIAKAMAPRKPAYTGTPPASGIDAAMHSMADQLHPVAQTIPITPNRVTGEFSK